MTTSYNVMGAVRLRLAGSSKTTTATTGQLSVPAGMMQFLEVGCLFRPEFTDEGILYRFVGDDAGALNRPSWAKS